MSAYECYRCLWSNEIVAHPIWCRRRVLCGGVGHFGSAAPAQQWLTEANTRIEQHRKANFTVTVVDDAGRAVSGADVHVQMKRHAFGFGMAVPASLIVSNSSNATKFRQKLLENFNQAVFENDLKYPHWLGLAGSGYNWTQTKQALDWLNSHDLPTRGHYLAWGTWNNNNAWGASQDVSTLPQRIFDHISDKLPKVGESVFEWDVINHPVGWLNDTYENRVEAAGLYNEGLDFYADIIQHARSVIDRPVAEGGLGGVEMPLWINEDNIIAGNGRANGYERVIDYLIAHDAAPDGIGFQGHFIEDFNGRVSNSTPEQVYDRIERFAQNGLPLRATEFDIDVGANEAWQAQAMHDYLTVMFSHPSMEAVTMWSFWQGSGWRPNAALYRTDWSEKPAMTEYRDLVFNEWWTDATGTSNQQGEYLVRAFKGEYELTVTYNGQNHIVSATLNDDASVSVSLPFSIALAGDYNDDGIVDAADYAVWRDRLGDVSLPNETVSLGIVDQEDYNEWRANFGQSASASGGSSGAVVPEPACATLVLLCVSALLLRLPAFH